MSDLYVRGAQPPNIIVPWLHKKKIFQNRLLLPVAYTAGTYYHFYNISTVPGVASASLGYLGPIAQQTTNKMIQSQTYEVAPGKMLQTVY